MISILVPSRSRPSGLAEMWNGAHATADSPDDVEVVVYVDTDDPDPVRAQDLAGRHTIVRGARINLGEMWNVCHQRAHGDIFMHCGDDIRFRSSGWDTQVRQVFEQHDDRIVFVHGDDGHWKERFGTHGFVHRNWTDAVGMFLPGFSCDYNDTWLNDVANMLGRRVYLPDVVTEHMHPAFGKAPIDQTHRDRMENGVRDNVDQVYKDRLPERVAQAEVLRKLLRG